jgi:hypothetical protein
MDAVSGNINTIRNAQDVDGNEFGADVNTIRNAQALHCAYCEHVFRPDEPVWRTRSGNVSRFIKPACDDCRYHASDYERASPCEGCRRPVYLQKSCGWLSTCCCKRCHSRARLAEARTRRRRARGTRACKTCGKFFKPTRTDSMFCSNACRQRAYRKRVTDNAALRARARKSRNAKRGMALSSEVAHG